MLIYGLEHARFRLTTPFSYTLICPGGCVVTCTEFLGAWFIILSIRLARVGHQRQVPNIVSSKILPGFSDDVNTSISRPRR